MIYGIGETYHDGFSTYNASNVLANADSLPTGVLVTNGTDGAAVTITNAGTGRYKIAASLAGRSVGDSCYVRVSATVGGLTQEQIKGPFRIAFASALSDNDGTAQAGGASTITLSASDTAVTNAYANRKLRIIRGTGANQEVVITANDGTTKVATVSPAWGVAPDNTSVYIIEGSALAALPTTEREGVADAMLDRANGIETGWTLRKAMRLITAVLAGKSSNGGTTYRNVTDTKPRVTATLDGDGNRTAVTLDGD